MAETLDFRHPDQQTLENSLHAPPPQLESYIEDLNASQVVHHHSSHRPRHSRLRRSHSNQSASSKHSASSLPNRRLSAQSNIDLENALQTTATVGVVSSGQVYKQLFDAGVQLRKRYDKAKADQKEKGSPAIKTRFGGVPLVHMSRDLVNEGTGILGERQQRWLTGFPNESDIENPVKYRYEQEQRLSDEVQSESELHLKEVRDLPDVVVCKKPGSDVITKISKSREERHESALDEMHQELLVVSTELEPHVEKAGHNLLVKLDDSDKELSSLIIEIDDTERLLSHSQQELKDIWVDIQGRSAERRLWIKNTIAVLNRIEDERADKVTAILSKYTDIVKAIAYVAAKADLDKVIDRESQLLNKTILSNRRSYAELNMRLLAADIERERKAHDLYNLRNGEWKKFRVSEALKVFQEFMSQSDVLNPPNVLSTIKNMVEDQGRVHQKRMQLLETTREFSPPTATKKSVYTWNDQLEELSSLLSEVNQRYMQQIYNDYEKVCEKCAQKATDLRAELIKSGAVEPAEADLLINDTFIPMIGRQQQVYESNMELMDKEIEKQCNFLTDQMTMLFKYCQGSAHIWDIHEIGLAQTERALQERLLISRRDHDLENQQRESQLDIVMDKMRQDANEPNLAKNLKKVKESLDVIKSMYSRFHRDQLEVVQTYPQMVKEELEDFDLVVRTYFAVDREQPGSSDAELHRQLEEALEPLSDEDRTSWESRIQSLIHLKGLPSQLIKKRLDFYNRSKMAAAQLANNSNSFSPRYSSAKSSIKSRMDNKSEKSTTAQLTSTVSSAVSGSGDVSARQEQSASAATARGPSAAAQSQKEASEMGKSRYFLDNLSTNPLPGEVGEVLITSKGTNFYVLAVATPEEDDLGDDLADRSIVTPTTPSQTGQSASHPTFMTEVEPRAKAMEQTEYLQSFAISTDFFTELKRSVRLNFITYMEDWTEQAMQRAKSIVAAKAEELNSELELRLHLHAPRARRAELDVHNVRAAELMMHNERVVRHCKGINQTLQELRVNFDKLLTEHQTRFEVLQRSVESMESVVLRANKSSMLVEQQAAVQKCKEDFMSDIRVSLRTFRRSLDDTLQLMRESNALFIKSFKLFSDGGNFCPEEIDVFRKNLDKYSHKVDDSEGAIMSELEGIEAKWLKKATQLAVDFEDRFKNHMIDLVFIEKVARWLTNTQVKIKGEVAESNEQAKRLAQHLNDLERRIDACAKPNPDKEVVLSGDLQNSLRPIFEAFHKRADYINCRLSSTRAADAAESAAAISKTSKVGFSESVQPVSSTITIGTKQKQVAEDPTIALVKNIYRDFQNSQEHSLQEAALQSAKSHHSLKSQHKLKSKASSQLSASQREDNSLEARRKESKVIVPIRVQREVIRLMESVVDPSTSLIRDIYKAQKPAASEAADTQPVHHKEKKVDSGEEPADKQHADSRPVTDKSGKSRSTKASRASERRSSVADVKNRHSSALGTKAKPSFSPFTPLPAISISRSPTNQTSPHHLATSNASGRLATSNASGRLATSNASGHLATSNASGHLATSNASGHLATNTNNNSPHLKVVDVKQRAWRSRLKIAQHRNLSPARRVMRFDRRDKRFQLFPEEPGVDADYYDTSFKDLLGKIKRTIREAHEGLISAAEVFYKQKGTHAITRPYALQPTMESCAETITRKLQSYFSQANDYHNQCLQEFRHQLLRLENLTERIPPLVIKDIERSCRADYEMEKEALETTFNLRMKQIDTKRHEHKTLLRPTLGHPNHADKLSTLCEGESNRSQLCQQEIKEHEVALKRLSERHSAEFVEKIARASSDLFLLFDDILTVDDVEKGKIIPNKYPTNELLRRNRAGEALVDKIPETLMPRGAATWEGLPTEEMLVLPTAQRTLAPSTAKETKVKADKAAVKQKTASTAKVHTQKTTIGHNATQQSRDEAYQVYKGKFFETVAKIEREKDERLLDESRWSDSWNNSIAKIRALY